LHDPESDDAGAKPGDEGMFPSTGINATELTVTSVQPASGPFAGGNRAVVRGSGFTADAFVYVGGRLVQPADTVLVDRNSLSIVLPAGDVGSADVRVEIGDDRVDLPDGYTYSALLLQPTSGSVAGGTSVVITLDDPDFTEGVSVEFGGKKCTDLALITPSQVRCKAPPGDAGAADVVARWPKAANHEPIASAEAFEYIDLTDNDRAGLSGGPIAGTLNVSVIDADAGLALPGALVLIGDDPKGKHKGLTDSRGEITFSGDDIRGPLTVHVAMKCMERASIVAFDAANVTVHLAPLMDPSCAMDGTPGGGGRGTRGALISGELIFPGSEEFGVNGWDVVPQPRANETRVAYVFTTRATATLPNPTPSIEGTMARVTEDSPIGVNGYPYSIFARPAGLAVYAISGLERRDTGEFMPYVMGVARNVVTAPGAETSGVDVFMDNNLDRELQLQFAHLPDATPRGPDQFRVEADIDLGAEGVIVRQVDGNSIDVATGYTAGTLFRLFAQPSLRSGLADARYQVIAGWYTSERANTPPYTEVRRLGVAQIDEPLVIDDLMPIPSVVAPKQGAKLPSDRTLQWELGDGDAKPDLYVIDIVGGDGIPCWTQIVPGSLTESALPDFHEIKGLTDVPAGLIRWSVRAIRIADFDYDEFKYDLLSPRVWTHTSIDTFSMQR
jgi:hypothetical protein